MEKVKENKMGTMPINRLIIMMSLPMMISMLVSSLYNIVDSIFVAQVNEAALTAVSLAFPVQNLIVAVQVGAGVGMNALLSRQLGEGNEAGARNTAKNGIVLAFLHYLVFLILGLTMVDTYLHSQTNDPQIFAYGKQYLTIIMVFSLGQFIQITFERLLQSTGQTIYSMYIQGIGAIINIILDYVLIFGVFGIPAMGVTGAALASVIGQSIAAVIGVYLHHKHNKELVVSYKELRLEKKTVREIYRVGIPSMVMTSITSLTTFVFNLLLSGFSSTAIAVYGIYYKLQSFIFMPVFGLNNGIIPILSYNYGAKNKNRMIKIIRYGIYYGIGIMLVGLLIFQLFPEFLLSFFNASEEMIQIGVPALRIISICFIFAGFGVVAGTIFQAFGRGLLSLSVSILRQLVIIIPVAYLLSLTGNLNAIWWSYPIAECFSVVLCAIYMRYIFKKYIHSIPDEKSLQKK